MHTWLRMESIDFSHTLTILIIYNFSHFFSLILPFLLNTLCSTEKFLHLTIQGGHWGQALLKDCTGGEGW